MINNAFDQEIRIPLEVPLSGQLSVPENAKGIIVFAHGSGSSRHSSRNKFVANVLQSGGFATLLFDLLTVEEDAVRSARFDIDLLTDRLVKVTDWLREENRTKDLSIGYFGASTGAAATLKAAALLGDTIKAVVSRGGRPDLAEPFLPQVKSPTLLIVGGLDVEVIRLNETALEALNTIKELRIVPAASHLFEEPGKLEEVAELASEWFTKYLVTMLKV